MKENKAIISRGQNVSESNTFKKPKGYKIMAKKSAENSPTTTQNQKSVITESSGRPPTVTKTKGSLIG